jgi:PhoH-like ATPase
VGFVGWIKGIRNDEPLSVLDSAIQEPPRTVCPGVEATYPPEPGAVRVARSGYPPVNLTGAAGSARPFRPRPRLSSSILHGRKRSRHHRHLQRAGFHPGNRLSASGTEAEEDGARLGAPPIPALQPPLRAPHGSVEYILERVLLQFKSLNYIRGRSFQSLILIDVECQNLTSHQMKTIITRAGSGSRVVSFGNPGVDRLHPTCPRPAWPDLPGPSVKDLHGVQYITLQGVPRSVLAEHAESHL